METKKKISILKDLWVEDRRFSIRMLAVCMAVETLLAFSPFGFIVFTGISVTTMFIGVMAGALWGGPIHGAMVGLIFGITSMWKATVTGVNANDLIFSPIRSGNPSGSVLLALGPRMLFGIVAGLVYYLIRKMSPKKAELPLILFFSAVLERVNSSLTYLFMDRVFHIEGAYWQKSFTNLFTLNRIKTYAIVMVVMAVLYVFYDRFLSKQYYEEFREIQNYRFKTGYRYIVMMLLTVFVLILTAEHLSQRLEIVLFDIHALSPEAVNFNRISQLLVQFMIAMLASMFIVVTIYRHARNMEEIARSKALVQLDLEKERASEMESRAMKDPLTGVYNRKGLEYIVQSKALETRKLGYLLTDIDHFKEINDTFGHDAGDTILLEVANELSNAFGKENVFRLGGDEFAVLITEDRPFDQETNNRVWGSICTKLRQINQSVTDHFERDVFVSLSVGICYGRNGYNEQLYRLADKALYETKGNGRAGCTIVDENGKVLARWQDEQAEKTDTRLLQTFSAGVTRFEYDPEGKKPGKMYCDAGTRSMLSASPEASPEELHELWESRIASDYRGVLEEARRNIMEKGYTDFTYIWNHPSRGRLLVHCGGTGEYKDGMVRILAYHQILRDVKKDETLIPEVENPEYTAGEKSLKALFDHVPGGIIMYEWNGKRLKTLHISDYCAKQYGGVLAMNRDEDGRNFMRIHPEDEEGYRNAITESLVKTQRMEYVLRVYNYIREKYVWVKVTAVADKQPNGSVLVYAMYSDVNEQMETEQALTRSRASLTAALSASNQLSYEYDPVEHTGICYADENGFGLPKVIENYPEALRDFHIFHPDDEELFIKTAHEMDKDGVKKTVCDVRIRYHEDYHWYTCAFDSYYDSEKKRNLAILTVIDITDRVNAMAVYEERIEAVQLMNDKSMTVGTFDLEANTYHHIRAVPEMKQFLIEGMPFEELMYETSKYIVSEEDRRRYCETFNRANLLKLAEQGQLHVQTEALFSVGQGHTRWLEAIVDLIKNPLTGKWGGLCYSRSIQDEYLSTMILRRTLSKDYPMMAAVFTQTDEFYVYNTNTGTYGDCRVGFWDILPKALGPVATYVSQSYISQMLTKETVLAELNKGKEVVRAFNSDYDGTRKRLEIRFTYLDEERHILFVCIRNITDIALQEQYRYDSMHDSLTGLYNRNGVFAECRRLLDEHPDEKFVMAHIDMRHFNLFNTFFGDAAGDQLLKDTADLFRWMDGDYEYWAYGRIEADVFCAFFPYEKGKFTKHLDQAIYTLSHYRDDFLIEPKIGIYDVSDPTMSIEAMFTRATIAAKNGRTSLKSPVSVYDMSMETELADETQIAADAQPAIDHEQFKVYLQPKYSLQTGEAVGAEALVRWLDPEKGLVPPIRFIPVFEKNGFISTLDRYMWEHVCILLKKWKAGGKRMIPVSVNVSRISMFSPTTVQFLKDLVKKYDIAPEYLELELTETAYMDDPEEMKIQMNELRNAGFKILMDDFGSGYSSLNAVRDLPVDCLKLDMKFLSADTDDERSAAVLSSIVGMTKKLNLNVIAEGVETREQADYLKSIGCECVQGYLYAKPMPSEEYEKLIA